MKGGCRFLWESHFFGRTPEYKVYLHKEIFSLAYYSEGAFNQEIVYKLPVYLRRFYLNELKLTRDDEKKQMEKNSGKHESTNDGISRRSFGGSLKT